MGELVVIRGAGDISSGTIYKLVRSGFKVVALEIENPSFIRRSVSYGSAIFEKEMTIEGLKSVFVEDIEKVDEILSRGEIPILIDSSGESIKKLKPKIVVDAILAKKNLGTKIDMADIVIGVGPGFTAGVDTHLVIETMRGHNLGRVISEGRALENTGVPGEIKGYSKERVIHSPTDGRIEIKRDIGEIVKKGDIICHVGEVEVEATMDGLIRGMISNGYHGKKGLKIADIDPRVGEKKNCYTISDKGRNIAGGVLEGIMYLLNKEKNL